MKMANMMKAALLLVGISFLAYGTQDVYPVPLKIPEKDFGKKKSERRRVEDV